VHVHIFFSVHEPLFHPIAKELKSHYGVESFSSFVWGENQRAFLEKENGVVYRPLLVFTRDVLPELERAAPDLAYLEQCETDYGIPLNRMIFAERHLLQGRDFNQVLRMVELTFRLVERTYRDVKPNWIFSEDISCMTSYIHWAVAKGMEIPFYIIGKGTLPDTTAIYTNQYQHQERLDTLFAEVMARGLTEAERVEASRFLETFRTRPMRPTGMSVYGQFSKATKYDAKRLVSASKAYYQDPKNPTNLGNPAQIIWRRLVRIYRERAVELWGLFEPPRTGERYVLFPLHLQPEATTLVQAPYYLNQPALIEDIAKSLPAGYRLYVKEHTANRGRWPLHHYRHIRNIFGVRLLGPDENSWQLIQNAAAIAAITSTMGWEGLLYEKPVITFGKPFYNSFPLVYRAGDVAKDQWHEVFKKAIFSHHSDRELLLKYVWSALHSTYPGWMATANTIPQVLDPENVKNLAAALADTIGLTAQ
jgi:hypothetical protein